MGVELRALYSSELGKPQLPEEPECCAVLMYADVGRTGKAATEASVTFNFTVITPSFLVKHPETRWAHSYLLVEAFSWNEVERMVYRLVSSVSADSWEKAAAQLSRYMICEFDNYQR